MTNPLDKQGLLLGKQTDYPREYSPNILQPIPRSLAREALPFGLNVGRGFDCWHLFELSWLDATGKPQVGIGRLMIPADSPNIVESKSLKLYCNSLNFQTMQSRAVLETILKRDIGQVIKAAISVSVLAVDALPVSRLRGDCIDDATLTATADEIQDMVARGERIKLLRHAAQGQQTSVDSATQSSGKVSEFLYSHLLRSNCPVTNQPDWGAVLIRYEGKQIDRDALMTYICAFREHNGFHEQCVEQIYADISMQLKPTKLLVQAWYTRRGGIDINPCRVSDNDWLPQPSRLTRQ